MTETEYAIIGIAVFVICKCSMWILGFIAFCKLGIKVCDILIQRNKIKLKELEND